jgi:hypothetical protein
MSKRGESRSNQLSNGDNNRTTTKVKKGSYPSKQQRFGAAPLASFEDLPSDDQLSPDFDDNGLRNTSPDRFAIESALDLDSALLLTKSERNDEKTSPTLTITPTGISSPIYSNRKESDTYSQNTLTLGMNFLIISFFQYFRFVAFIKEKIDFCFLPFYQIFINYSLIDYKNL